MNVKTYRAKTMQEALAQVRRELGPKASVLHTREVRAAGLLRLFTSASEFEVMASANVTVPSRLAARDRSVDALVAKGPAVERRLAAAGGAARRYVPERDAGVDLHEQLARLHASAGPQRSGLSETPTAPLDDALFRLFTDLIEADVCEDLARELVERVRGERPDAHSEGATELRSRALALVEAEIGTTGPLQPGAGRRHLVALVGPTGVGKTTTIAKLAANFRLRDKLRVGLITVDTYRIAAVEQLRTYADIIDLPMEIVATPREMHQAVARMADQDLILMDTAGRSPRDEVKIQELRAILAEAAPDEVHLVLSSVSSAANLSRMAKQFAAVGTTAVVLTKLDEAASLGNVLPLLRASGLPLSYLTHGQNVPDDIAPAEAGRLARMMLGMEPMAGFSR